MIRFVCSLVGGLLLAATCGIAQAITINDTFTATTPTTTQTGRLFRDGLPGTCSGKVEPAVFDAVAHRYNSYAVQNNGAAACVTVDVVTQAGCTSSIFVVAYTPSFNPANIVPNYLSDNGFGNNGGADTAFSFIAPANSTVVLDVAESGGAGVCNYTLQVNGLSNVVPTTSEWGLALLALILGSAAFLVIRRRGR
jgi:hypothetical protein